MMTPYQLLQQHGLRDLEAADRILGAVAALAVAVDDAGGNLTTSNALAKMQALLDLYARLAAREVEP